MLSFCRFLILFTLLATASQAAVLSDRAALMERLDREGEVSIIVTFNTDTAHTMLKSGSTSDTARSSFVSSLQTQMLSALDKNDYRTLHRFIFTPQLSLRVNKKAFNALLRSPNIQINENKFRRASLQQSIPRVFSNQQTSEYTGNNQWAVAILDTGVDKNHGFLKTGSVRKVISEACYSGAGGAYEDIESLCPNGEYSTTASGAAMPCDFLCAHGTHVAGIAVGDGSSVDGVARLGKLIAIQVFSRSYDPETCSPASYCLVASDSDIIKGLERVYALRNSYKIAAINLSLGEGAFANNCDGEPHKPIIDMLRASDIATVIASGNNGYSGQLSSPACISSAIAVGSTLDNADTRSIFSNNSAMLDLYAPGSNIRSSVPGGGFVEYSGTSMAAPHVAGAWAVMRHAMPHATVSQIESAFAHTGPEVSYSGVSRRRIDISAALSRLRAGVIIPPIIQLLLFD